MKCPNCNSELQGTPDICSLCRTPLAKKEKEVETLLPTLHQEKALDSSAGTPGISNHVGKEGGGGKRSLTEPQKKGGKRVVNLRIRPGVGRLEVDGGGTLTSRSRISLKHESRSGLEKVEAEKITAPVDTTMKDDSDREERIRRIFEGEAPSSSDSQKEAVAPDISDSNMGAPSETADLLVEPADAPTLKAAIPSETETADLLAEPADAPTLKAGIPSEAKTSHLPAEPIDNSALEAAIPSETETVDLLAEPADAPTLKAGIPSEAKTSHLPAEPIDNPALEAAIPSETETADLLAKPADASALKAENVSGAEIVGLSTERDEVSALKVSSSSESNTEFSEKIVSEDTFIDDKGDLNLAPKILADTISSDDTVTPPNITDTSTSELSEKMPDNQETASLSGASLTDKPLIKVGGEIDTTEKETAPLGDKEDDSFRTLPQIRSQEDLAKAFGVDGSKSVNLDSRPQGARRVDSAEPTPFDLPESAPSYSFESSLAYPPESVLDSSDSDTVEDTEYLQANISIDKLQELIIRIAAGVIDFAIISGVFFVIVFICSAFGLGVHKVQSGDSFFSIFENSSSIFYLFFFLLLIGYEVLAHGLSGHTLGKRVFKLRMVDEQKQNVGFFRPMIRVLVFITCGLTLFFCSIVFVSIIFNTNNFFKTLAHFHSFPFSFLFIIFCLFLGNLSSYWILFDRNFRGWHDRISGVCIARD